jgi:hypothetical protein
MKHLPALVDEVRIASPIQIDMVRIKGCGEEAARAILDEVIRPAIF